MATSNVTLEHEDSASTIVSYGRDRWQDQGHEKSSDRTVTTEPKLNSWMIVAAGSVVPLGLAGAALATTYVSRHEQVAVSAWISVAIVGTASVISAAVVSHRRIVSVGRNDQRNKTTDRSHESPQ